MNTKKARIGVIGNLLGHNTGYVTTQGQVLASLLEREGYDVISASSRVSRPSRLLDVVWTLSRNNRRIELLIVEVYSGLGFVLADITSLLARVFGIRAIFALHGGNLPGFAKRYPGWVKRVFGRAEVLVAPSSFLAEAMTQSGFDVRVIPNVIDLDRYTYRSRREISPEFLWMRSFHAIYNPLMALKAFAVVKRQLPDAKLVMAGVDKGLEGSVKKSADEMGLNDAVRFPGFLDEDSKIREFSGASIYINTNRIDNMPVSVVEACAMGVPVVATSVGGLSHLITHGQNGLLVKDDDPSEMADSILRLLSDPDLTERLSRNGRLLAERSSWISVRNLWERAFIDATQTPTPSDLGSNSSNPT